MVLLAALVLRIGWAGTRPTTSASIDVLPDQGEYLSIADNLLHGRGYQSFDRRFADTVRAFRTPGYPLFVAACGANVRVVRVCQALLDTSTILAVYILAGMLVGRRDGVTPLVAAALVAFNPYLIYFTGLVLSETLFTAMLAWGMALLILGNGGRGGSLLKTLTWLAGGVLLGLSVLVRPSAMGLPIVLGILSTFVNRAPASAYQQTQVLPFRWPLPTATTMVVVVLLSLLPWAVRNRAVLGRWIWLDTNAGFTLYDGYNPDADGGSDQTFVTREPELQVLGEVDRSEYLTRKAFAFARSHPGTALGLAVAKLGRMWSPMPLSENFGTTKHRVLALLYSVPFDILLLFGLLRGNLPRTAKVFLVVPAIYLSMVHALTVGSLRYRIPVEPVLAILAASAVVALMGVGEPGRRPRSVA
jgi:4-amino-4-deoxy-L-arabinose transferase-like glycosyltransferase